MTPQQLLAIRDLSLRIYGKADEATRIYGTPATTEEAEHLLASLREMLTNQATAPTETKPCSVCKQQKPLDEFYKGHAQCKRCIADKAKARDAKKATKRKTSKPPVPAQSDPKPKKPDPLIADTRNEPKPEANGHATPGPLHDPSLSQLRALAEHAGVDLEDAAAIWLKVAELA